MLEVSPHSEEEKSDSQQQREPNAISLTIESREHILVVEDHPQMVHMITATLISRYRVTSACDGQEGLAKAIALRPDLILCDVSMPRMNGEQLVKALRAQSDFDNVPIVVLSGRTDEQLRIQLLHAGAQDFLLKPFHYEELRVRVANLLTIRRVRHILQLEVISQSHDVAILASEVSARKQELTQALSLLRQREAHLQDQANQLERRNCELERLSEERDRAREAINHMASIVEFASDAIFSKTLEGVITSWNGGAEKLYGYGADEMIGQSFSRIIPPDRQTEISEIMERISLGIATQSLETTRMRKDGTLIDVSTTICPILDGEKKIIGMSTISHDITEQKQRVKVEALAIYSRELVRMNNELLQHRDELTSLNGDLLEANQVREQFLATMSHELRTPLASIIGFSEFLLEEAQLANWNKDQQNSLERILRNGEHLLNLINDVLDISKFDAGRMVVSTSQVNVKTLLTSVIEDIQSLTKASALVLRIEIEEGLDYLETNPLKLHQILLNLISNALKFTEHGEVTVSAKQVFLSDKKTKGIAIAVKDTGIGIPQDIQERIFEAFYQADGSYTRKSGGTGLGLSIVSRLTALLGGTITLVSAHGQGSTFTVILPINTVAEY